MESDDHQIGQMLSRREALGVISTMGLMLTAGCRPGRGSVTDTALSAMGVRPGPGACGARPASIEGPYFVDEKLNRSDIRTDPSTGEVKPGVPLSVTFNVSRISGSACAPVAGLMVDLWQCDHLGVYSDVIDPRFDTKGKRFLRGYQTTDVNGAARFNTIYPGWYSGRPAHLHFKIRSASSSGPGLDFTSQLYFAERVTAQVHAQPPYAAKGQADVRNSEDRFYRRGGDQLLLALAR